MTQSFFHLVFVVTFTSFTLIRIIYHRKAYSTAGKVEYKEGGLSSLLRGVFGISYILLLFGYMVYPRLLAWAAVPLPQWARWLGVIFSILVPPLILWVQWALGSNFSTRLHLRETHTLVTHGPYRWVRHPMYSVMTLQALGMLLVTANAFIGLAYLIGLWVIILFRTPMEEAMMIEKFGDEYRAYTRRTGLLLPRLRKYPQQS